MNNKNGQSAAECVLVKPIKGWEGLYEIYSDGRVYSLVSNKFLKPRLSMDGYERVALCDKGKRYEYRVHRLVAEAFIENSENKPQINHKDFNKRNNVVNNLEWCTNLENVHYSINNNRIGFGNQKQHRDGKTGKIIPCKIYTFTNVYNENKFSIIGIKNIIKQFKCSLKNIKAILCKYANTGFYVKQGIFKGLRVDTEYVEVHRLTANHGVESSDSKYQRSDSDRDIVNSLSKDKAVNKNAIVDDLGLTTLNE